MIEFTVFSKPEPQGSSKAFMPKGARFPIVTSDNPALKGYRQQIAIEAMSMMRESGQFLIERKSPLKLTVSFYVARPASKSKKAYPVCRPDLDKLCRAIGDALTGICYEDDSQITKLEAEKIYGVPQRTIVKIESAE